MKKIITLIGIIFLLFTNSAMGQTIGDSNSKSVTLVTSGTGKTEDEAVKNALRKAIEQTYGTFVSSNTSIVNDELIKDEIVSISSGNIESYNVIDCQNLKENIVSVTVKATVSIGKLVKYAQSKGSTAELAGATFAMNMKMRKLNKENELQALKDMFEKLIYMANSNILDYTITPDEPKVNPANDSMYCVILTIKAVPNQNFKNIVDVCRKTIQSLSLSGTEQEEYTKTNLNFYRNFFDGSSYRNTLFGIKDLYFALRNDIQKITDKDGLSYIDLLRDQILFSEISFQISDNLGNKTKTNVKYYRGITNKDDLDIYWPLYHQDYTDYSDLYSGITVDPSSPNKNFLGGSKSGWRNNMKTYKSLWDESDTSQFGHYPVFVGYYSDNKASISLAINQNVLFEDINGCWKYCFLDLDKTAEFKIYLEYNMDTLSKISSIKISPTDPTVIKGRKIHK